MPIRWDNVARAMVMESMPFEHAMGLVGYKESYLKTDGHKIKQDPRFSKAIEGYKAIEREKSVFTREDVEREYKVLYTTSKRKGNEHIARTCLDSYCKLNGYNQEQGTINVDKQVTIVMFNAPPEPVEAITHRTPTTEGSDVIDAQRVTGEEEAKPPGGGG